MKVAQHSLELSSQHQHAETHQQQLHIEVIPPPHAPPPAQNDMVLLSDPGQHAAASESPPDESFLSAELMLLKIWLENWLGISIHLFDPRTLSSPNGAPASTAPALPGSNTNTPSAAMGGSISTRTDNYHEQEALQLSGHGSITTQDGQQFNFTLNVSTLRNFSSTNSHTVRTGAAAKDPLLLTLDGNAASFSDAKVSFQLDPNSRNLSELPMLKNGGWLMLDRNHNGKVDNGSELFGPASGNGFRDLAQLDSNHDGVLDDNDPLFADLKLWQGRAGGKDKLTSLKSLHIGAILLDNVAAPFSFRDGHNQEVAVSRRAGVYLSEDGKAGQVSQVDVSA